jgi:hypothetical protein
MKISAPRRRGFFRALVAGVAAHYFTLGALLLCYWLLRPFVWAALYGVPYAPPQRIYEPNSGEWLFIQAIDFASWIAAGAATIRWSSPGFPFALLVLGSLFVGLVLFANLPDSAGTLRMLIYYLEIPVALIFGAAAYGYWAKGATVAGA